MTVEVAVGEKQAYAYVGNSPVRLDARSKVTGRAIFIEDMHIKGMLYGKVLRSKYAHARIVAIDTSRAEALPGAKGKGETNNVPLPPAIAGAIYDAVGVRIRSLPITPDKILKALRQQAQSAKK